MSKFIFPHVTRFYPNSTVWGGGFRTTFFKTHYSQVFVIDNVLYNCLTIWITVWGSFWYPSEVRQPFDCQATASWSPKTKVAYFVNHWRSAKAGACEIENWWVGADFHFLGIWPLLNLLSCVVIFVQRLQRSQIFFRFFSP